MKKLILLFTIINCTISVAQTIKNREAFSLNIAANEEQQYAAEIPESPYLVKENVIQLYCSETVFVECEIAGDSISSMKVVAKNVSPKKTIEIKFTQNSSDRKKISTMLSLNNPFNKDLIYEAIILTPQNQEWHATSIIPIRSNLMNFETWGHSIVSIVLMNWKFK